MQKIFNSRGPDESHSIQGQTWMTHCSRNGPEVVQNNGPELD